MDWKDWSATRIIRLLFAGYMAFVIFETKEWGWLVIVAFLLYQVYTNQKCGCAGGSCATPAPPKSDIKTIETEKLEK
jgi:hypothetical protein